MQTRTTYGGTEMWTPWAGLWVLEQILNQHRFEGIIELGTMKGGLSQFFSDQCKWRLIDFFKTYDLKDSRERPYYGFKKGDILNDPKIEREIGFYLERGKWLLYCDNGNKPKEVEIYAPMLNPGSIIGVHDFGKEISEPDVIQLTNEFAWEPIMEDECIQLDTKQRFWLRR